MSDYNSNGVRKKEIINGLDGTDPVDDAVEFSVECAVDKAVEYAVDISKADSSSISSAGRNILKFGTGNRSNVLHNAAGIIHPLSQSLPDIRGEPYFGNHDPLQGEGCQANRCQMEQIQIVRGHNTAKPPLFPSSWLVGMKSNARQKLTYTPPYSIEYSVFRPVSHTKRIRNDSDMKRHLLNVLKRDGYDMENGEWPENDIDVESFNRMVNQMVYDVEHDTDLKPLRISQGSSGSYFIRGKVFGSVSANGGGNGGGNEDGSVIGNGDVHEGVHEDYNEDGDGANASHIIKKGIFKPKDEEPYGPLSPKWSKWLHRTFFPCFFGRSCLIPNLGYISEAAACVLDRQLLLYIVPYTDIIHLKSSQFYYTFLERTRMKNAYKIGSFQCFLHNYIGANVFLKQWPFPQSLDDIPDDTFQLRHENDPRPPEFFWSKNLICQFQDELEKLVILDYIMRNTDRGSDNWMIKVEWIESGYDGISKRMTARLRIGAIDSGLAFPWKHPDEWRSFPFGWLFLPYHIIGQPFSTKTRKHLLPLLTSKYWWEQTVLKLKAVFQKDADFRERMWHKQLAVLKGQVFNVVEVLKSSHGGPLELIRRENLMIWDDLMNVPSMGKAIDGGAHESSSSHSSPDNCSPNQTATNGSSPDDSTPNHTETTPFFASTQPNRIPHGSTSVESNQNRQMSGFDYNMKFEDPDIYKEDDETDTKMVVIERLEKVSSKRPCFTWC